MQIVARTTDSGVAIWRKGWAFNMQNAALAVLEYYSRWHRQLAVLITGEDTLEVHTDTKIISLTISEQ
jgi:hypothetical protein